MELCRYAVRLPDSGVIMPVRSGGTRGRFMRFDKDWRPDTGFTNEFDAQTTSCMNLQRLKDGKLLLGGLVGRMNGEECSGLVRLEQTGAIDHSFRCQTSNDDLGRVLDFAIQDDGRIVICGYFSQVNGIPRQYFARLNPDGSIDPTFRPPFVAVAKLDMRRPFRVTRLATAPATGTNSASVGTNDLSGATNAVPSETIHITSLTMESGVPTIRFSGRVGQLYVLQARRTMQAGEWVNISTNRSGPDGTGVLRDAQSDGSSMGFYRIANP